jgi:hypothetical protein
MPTITETPVRLHVFCPNGACVGYETHEVDGLAREVSRTAFEEAGPGTVNGNVTSTSFMQFLVPSGETDEHGYSIAAELTCLTARGRCRSRARSARSTPTCPTRTRWRC